MQQKKDRCSGIDPFLLLPLVDAQRLFLLNYVSMKYDLIKQPQIYGIILEKIYYEKGGAGMDYATLGKDKEFTVFKYGSHTIRFLAPYSLERYTAIKSWDQGYLVVMAKYKHNMESEEEYIDLGPILKDLYYSPEAFLRPIKEVKLENA